MDSSQAARKKRVFTLIEVGNDTDFPSRAYDFISMTLILVNLAAITLATFAEVQQRYGPLLNTLELATAVFFAVDYALRVWTAAHLYPHLTERRARLRYVFSGAGIIDLLSFLPFFLPIFLPTGAVAFRMFRIVRILRLFRINAYYDSLNVITEVIMEKRQQLLSSVFIILVLMLASSLCMYSLEHEAQPQVFQNAFSGIWWATATMLTVGYGDIYPITTMGRFFSIIITFLGVGLVAIPTGIISAGFVDQYTRAQHLTTLQNAADGTVTELQEATLHGHHPWTGKTLGEIEPLQATHLVMVLRGRQRLAPLPDLELKRGDVVLFYE